MFPYGNETFWLTVINAALGFAVLVLFILLGWSVIREIHSRKSHRRG